MGGKLKVESEVGVGTKFIINFKAMCRVGGISKEKVEENQ